MWVCVGGGTSFANKPRSWLTDEKDRITTPKHHMVITVTLINQEGTVQNIVRIAISSNKFNSQKQKYVLNLPSVIL